MLESLCSHPKRKNLAIAPGNFAVTLLLLAFAKLCAFPTGFTRTVIASNLDPSFICALKDGRVLFNEKHGVVRVIKDDKLLDAPMLDISAQVNNANERGLLGITVDPNFATNGWLYVFHNDKDDHGHVSRFTVTGDVADKATELKVFDMGKHGGTYHHGGDLQFGPDGKLYITQGNGAGALGDVNAVSQNKNELFGSIMRINADGTIPTDNPFYGTNDGDARAVWTYGNRNPFNVRFQPGTGLGYFSDVQDNNADDEINEAKAGGNYGYGGGPNPIDPIINYGGGGAAQIGGAWYAATQFPPEYRGLFFFGNSGNGNIKTLDPKSHKVATFDGLPGDCPISLDVGADGSLYASTRCGVGSSVNNGKIYKLTYPAGVSNRATEGGVPAAAAMEWTSQGAGKLTVKLLRAGSQRVELRHLDGTMIAQAVVSGSGPVELAAGSQKGLAFLIWRGASESERAVAKVMLP